jgi:hypothetical protein
MKRKALLMALTFVCSFAVLAQTNTPQQPKPEPTYVDFSGFKGKIFELKNRDPRELVPILAPLGSGFKGATMQSNSEMKTLTVRDFPENIATIEEAIKRLDTPKPPKPEPKPEPINDPPNIELHLHVLLAHNVDPPVAAASDPKVKSTAYPAEIDDVLKQLRATINYKNYHLLTSIVQRTIAFTSVQGNGVVLVGTPLFDKAVEPNYQLSIRRIGSSNFRSQGPLLLSIDNFHFEIEDRERIFGKAFFNNTLAIREGEKLVVGTASLKDKALVLVLTVKVIK